MPIFDSFNVSFWTKDHNGNGLLRITKNGMQIEFESGCMLSENDRQDTYYEIDTQILPGVNGDWYNIPLEESVRIQFKPLFTISRPYAHQGGQYIEEIFPPSTAGFYGRLRNGYEKHQYIVQQIIGDSKLWLTIANSKTGQIYEAHSIFPYEAGALSIISSQEFRNIWYGKIWSTVPSSVREEIRGILNHPSISWKEFSKILENISIPDQPLGETMREMLTPLIPESFPETVREQLMIFLVYVLKNDFNVEDPIDYLYKYWSFPILGALLEGHLMCVKAAVPYPPYLKLMTLAGRRDLGTPDDATPQDIIESPWLLFWQKTWEQFPNWYNIAAEIVKELNSKGKLVDKIPITKSAAKKSTQSWKKRLAILIYELRIVGRIYPEALGLTELVYLGSAYRWPHKHMKFITCLGRAGESSPYLQVMVMPPSAALQVKRVLPNIIEIGSTTRISNISLFNTKKMMWDIPTQRILSSVEEQLSPKRLTSRYQIGKYVGNSRITPEEAKISDLAAEGIRLGSIERKEYLDPWGLDIRTVNKTLASLQDRKIIQIYYETSTQNLISLATVMHGPPKSVASICSAFLDTTPSTLMMLGSEGNQSILISKLPEESAYELASKLPSYGLEHDVTIRCLRPTSFQSYAHNLYQRLLKEDGTWDDDVSAFLSQARSKRKELSESNA